VTGALHRTGDLTAVVRTKVSLLVYHPDIDEGNIAAVGPDDAPVSRQFDMVRLPCRAHLLHLSLFSLPVIGHHFYRPRFIAGLHPHQAVSFLAVERLLRSLVVASLKCDREILGAPPLAFPVNEEFRRRIASVYHHGNHLALPALPVPVRQDVEGGCLVVPVASVEVIAVLGDPRQVNDSEEGAVTRPVGIVRGGFPKVVEAGPHKLPDTVFQVFVLDEVVFGEV